MSYFMTVTGTTPDLAGIQNVRLESAQKTQVAETINKLFPDKAEETYLVIDETRNTSHNLVNDAVDSLINNTPIENSRFFKVLNACFNVSCLIRIWWADPLDRDDLIVFQDKEKFKNHIIECFNKSEDVNVFYQPAPK